MENNDQDIGIPEESWFLRIFEPFSLDDRSTVEIS